MDLHKILYTLKKNWTTCLFVIGIFLLGINISLTNEIWIGKFSRSWDGSGHWAIAHLYSNSSFPNSLGWILNYFGGMPFPNFYPPVFYWLVALISQFFSFEIAFKLVITFPTLLLPLVLWRLIYNLTNKNQIAAWAGSIGSLFLLLDSRFIFALPAGLDFFSTFQIGLYTQPLGFVFLLLWYISFQKITDSRWRFSLSTILLALTVLTNIFAGMTATLMATVVIFEDLICLIKIRKFSKTNTKDKNLSNNKLREEYKSIQKHFLSHTTSSFLALCLTLFWVIPMTSQYDYFVTRPFVVETNQLLSSVWWIWFVLAFIGFYFWYLNPTKAFWSFTISCLILTFAVIFATFIAPDWFPLQSPRFLAMLNFLLVVPVGLAVSKSFRWFAKLLGEIKNENDSLTFRKVKYSFGTFIFLLVLLVVTSPGTRTGAGYAFIAKGEKPEIEQILEFAKEHTNGRYLVEVIHPQKSPAFTDAAFDGRAINAYLGSNGNETISAVFHEASPHSLFMLPAINGLSDYPDSFGISSILSDDLDFQAQPIEKHIERAKFLGVKYLIIRTPTMKEKLAKSTEISQKTDFGWWTIYELKTEPEVNPIAKILPNRPALVLSNFTLKARYRNDLSYIRFIEEQFSDGWFDVLLARSTELKIDKLQDWENFGAIIINDYKYEDENQAFQKINEIAKKRLIILISSEDTLFQKIQQNKAEFLKLVIVERPQIENPGEMLKSDHPTFHYNGSPIRQVWLKIKETLDTNKVPVSVTEIQIKGQKLQNKIQVNFSSQEEVPIVINNTFHPSWYRNDNKLVYAVTPFNQLVFANQDVEIVFRRNSLDKAGLWISGITFVGLLGFSLFSFSRKKNKIKLEKTNPTYSADET